MREKLRRVVAAWLVFVNLVVTTDLQTLAATNDAEMLVSSETACNSVSDGDSVSGRDLVSGGNSIEEDVTGELETVPREMVYEGENYKIIYTLNEVWPGGYSSCIQLHNTGSESIENWYLSFETEDTLVDFWNAQIYEQKSGEYVIANAGWNADISVGESVQFGFLGSNDFVEFPSEYELLGEFEETEKNDYSVNYVNESNWEGGFTGKIVITNNTDKTIEDWIIEFDFSREISYIWNGIVDSYENGHYVICNAEYNANLLAGQSITIGFTGRGGTESDIPQNYCLYSCSLYNGESMEIDTDGDGIVDGNETLWGLDYRTPDGDGDDLTDWEEINLSYTDPLAPDTDRDGILDAQDDEDGDGIENKTEIVYGTDPLSADTDGDNLTDYDEICVYKTEPYNIDTDGDLLTDYNDIELGFDPLLPDTELLTDALLLKLTIEYHYTGTSMR